MKYSLILTAVLLTLFLSFCAFACASAAEAVGEDAVIFIQSTQ